MRQDLASVFSRCDRVHAGLVVGFTDETLDVLKAHRPGVWIGQPLSTHFPYEDCQFDVAVIHPDGINKEQIREINRVLKPQGYLFFSVDEFSVSLDGCTPADIYAILREGFDILEIRTPKWWHFGLSGKSLTVCARKKAWREHKLSFIRNGILPFTPFRSR